MSETIVRTRACGAGADAMHPGFGFLAENAAFARACAAAGLVFVGPPPEAIEAMGIEDRRARADAGGGRAGRARHHRARWRPSRTRARDRAREIGYPVAVKAAAGGGGKGIEVVAAPERAAARATSRARRRGQGVLRATTAVYLERYLDDPRHVEVQVLADAHGDVVHLGERDCSIQRRHQKIVEETPSPAVTPELRERIGAIGGGGRAGGRLRRTPAPSRACWTRDGTYYFLEMNTRLQVEHTITEMVTGLDLVREQLRIASGRAAVDRAGGRRRCAGTRSSAGSTPRIRPGTSCRRRARVTRYREPSGPGVRVDSGVGRGRRRSPSCTTR